MRIGIFPYKPSWNPYQELFSGALEAAGLIVTRIPPRKWFPLQYALSRPLDILHLDWPHDFYNGRTPLRRVLKQAMYLHGLRTAKERRLVWTAHNLIGHDAVDADYEKRMVQRLVDVCSGIVCLSAAAETALRDAYRVSAATVVKVIPHGHYIDVYPNAMTRREARERLGIGDDSRVVLSLGRIMPYKGLEDLIAAFGAVASAGDALLICGGSSDPGFIARLQALAAPMRETGRDVRIVSETIPERDLQIFYNACDLAAYPFRQILNSGSVIMAMSFGRCFVAPTMGSVPEVAYPRAYFGYAPDDPDGLASAMRAALQHDDLAARGAEGKEHARRLFDWTRIGTMARGLYSELLEDRARR